MKQPLHQRLGAESSLPFLATPKPARRRRAARAQRRHRRDADAPHPSAGGKARRPGDQSRTIQPPPRTRLPSAA